MGGGGWVCRAVWFARLGFDYGCKGHRRSELSLGSGDVAFTCVAPVGQVCSIPVSTADNGYHTAESSTLCLQLMPWSDSRKPFWLYYLSSHRCFSRVSNLQSTDQGRGLITVDLSLYVHGEQFCTINHTFTLIPYHITTIPLLTI